MSLKVGIVGLPNVGKSRLFNALMKRSVAAVANYPFTTIKPHIGVVGVPDERLVRLAETVTPRRSDKSHRPRSESSKSHLPGVTVVPATVTFVDIAGLVKNAHKGEGLGNEFLGQIRDVDAVVHVLRAFESGEVAHVMGGVDPDRDREIIESELSLAEIDKPIVEWINRDEGQFENLEGLIRQVYKRLGLITFYTIKGGREVKAWGLKKGAMAVEAAGRVHTDFAQRFIKAQVIEVDELLEIGGWKEAKERGRIRLEGREYLIKEGDVVEFLVGTG